jgi:xanthine/CO dehydrogenase XdhC/CoxF family maturation factor
MSAAQTLLNLIVERSSEAEPIAVVRIIDSSAASSASVFWRSQFHPRLEASLERIIADRIQALLVGGTSTQVFSIATQDRSKVVAIEVVRPKMRLVVFGAGHVGHAVALLGVMLGNDVLVVDDRPEFVSRTRFPDGRIALLVADLETAAAKAGITSSCAVVIVTRGHQSDEACLRSVLRTKARYIGMIGSRRRVLGVFNRLEQQGFSRSELESVHAPIGLRIGARTPQEIAVSIMAEVIACVNAPELTKNERT